MAVKKRTIKLTFTPSKEDHKNHHLCVNNGIRIFPIPFEGGYKLRVEWSNGKKQVGKNIFSLYTMDWLEKVYEIYGSIAKKIK